MPSPSITRVVASASLAVIACFACTQPYDPAAWKEFGSQIIEILRTEDHERLVELIDTDSFQGSPNDHARIFINSYKELALLTYAGVASIPLSAFPSSKRIFGVVIWVQRDERYYGILIELASKDSEGIKIVKFDDYESPGGELLTNKVLLETDDPQTWEMPTSFQYERTFKPFDPFRSFGPFRH